MNSGKPDRVLTDGGRTITPGSPDTLFEALTDPAMLVDGDGPRVVRVNEAFESVFDTTARALRDGASPELREDAAAVGRTTRDGDAVEREVSRRTGAGELREFLFRTVPLPGREGETRAYAIYTDITERKAYERNLTALHETARRLMTAESTDAVLDIAVHATRDILGFEVNSIHRYDESREALVPAAYTDRTEAVLGDIVSFDRGDSIAWRVFETGEYAVRDDVREDPDVLNPETSFRSELLLPLGEYGVLLAASTELGAFDESDVSLAQVLAATIESALGRAQREETLRERERALARQNERLEEFASVVSHDLRKPLDLAGVHLELGTEGMAETDHFDDVAAAHDRMADLIDDVLTWAREGDAVEATELVSLPVLLADCWGEADTADATLDVRTERTVRADRSRLRQVVDNLVENAIAYAGPGATVTVGDLSDGDGLFVADDGPGVPPEEREAVFDSGHTLSMAGTGFGLAIVRQIVEAHGWTITLTESGAGGARFEIRC